MKPYPLFITLSAILMASCSPSEEQKKPNAQHVASRRKLWSADITIAVDAHADWQQTGVLVKAGQIVNLYATVTDAWTIALPSPHHSGLKKVSAAGYTSADVPQPNWVPCFHQGVYGINYHLGSLIGAVAAPNTDPTILDSYSFEAGTQYQYVSPRDGYLWLNCNDSRYVFAYYHDNEGIIHVRVQVP